MVVTAKAQEGHKNTGDRKAEVRDSAHPHERFVPSSFARVVDCLWEKPRSDFKFCFGHDFDGTDLRDSKRAESLYPDEEVERCGLD